MCLKTVNARKKDEQRASEREREKERMESFVRNIWCFSLVGLIIADASAREGEKDPRVAGDW